MPSTTPFPVLSSTPYGTVGYFSSGWPVAYLVAAMILLVGIGIGAVMHVSQPAQVARQSAPGPWSSASRPAVEMKFVGRITDMVDCRWADPQTEAFNGASVPLGRTYALASGLMEISYNTGAKVILQGPCNYEVESVTGGF
jgi:hypothetical protein